MSIKKQVFFCRPFKKKNFGWKDQRKNILAIYLPRPILHIKAKENSEMGAGGKRHIRSLTFADAVSQ
jgi:hypothetical protein